MTLCLSGAMAGPVWASLVAPVCAYASDLRRFVNHEAATGADWQYVNPSPVGDGFVFWRVQDLYGRGDGSDWLVLEHCKGSPDKLLVTVGRNADAVLDRFDDMVFGDRPYTMRQMGEALAPLGAGVRIYPENFGSCACDAFWGATN